MMIQRMQRTRRGVTTVELGLVSIFLFMMLFGILEYCRLLYVTHTASNSARDTARFAVVHTNGGAMPGEPATISAADLNSLFLNGQIGSYAAGSGMGGMDKNIENLKIEIFAVDPAGLSQSPPVIQPAPGSSWNDTTFSQQIAVRISGNYRPVLPSLLFMNSTVPIQITVMASSEAN